MSVSSLNPSLVSTATTPSATAAAGDSSSVFGEIWDTINPLQHIPIVSSLYRAVSDTSISSFANIAGSTIYGGPIGGAVAAAQEGVSALGHAIFGSSKTATATAAPVTAVQASKIEPSTGATYHHKMHATTHDWLYQNLNNETAALETASNTNTPAASTNASSAYLKVQGLTRDYLNPILPLAQTDKQKTA